MGNEAEYHGCRHHPRMQAMLHSSLGIRADPSQG